MLLVICMSKRDRKIRARSAVTEHPRSSAQQRRITTTTVSQVHVWLTNDTQYLAWFSQQGILSKCQDSKRSSRMCVSCERRALHEIGGHLLPEYHAEKYNPSMCKQATTKCRSRFQCNSHYIQNKFKNEHFVGSTVVLNSTHHSRIKSALCWTTSTLDLCVSVITNVHWDSLG